MKELEARLEAWRDELKTNANGFAHFAEQIIRDIEYQIEKLRGE